MQSKKRAESIGEDAVNLINRLVRESMPIKNIKKSSGHITA